MTNKVIVLTLCVGGGGRLTIPAHVRRSLSIEEGDLVEVAIRPLKPSTDTP